MSRLAKIQPNKVRVNLEDYVTILFGEKKTGKSTLFRDLVNLHYNGDMSKGVLMQFEPGANALDGLYAPEVMDWDDWEEYVEDFVDNRDEIPFRLICIDTIDEFVRMAIDKVLYLSKKKDGKTVDSIQQAFGGFNRGKEKALSLMRTSINTLKKNGFGLVFIGHTKLKKKNTGNLLTPEQEYMQLCCSLTDDYAGLFENMADIIAYLVVDKTVNNIGADVKKRTAKSTVKIHFRSNGEIDCGGRLKGLPEVIDYSAEEFLKAFEQGVKSSMLQSYTDVDIAKIKEEQQAEVEEKVKELNKELTNEELFNLFRDNFNDLGDAVKQQIQQIIVSHGIGLEQLADSREALMEIYTKFLKK